MRRKRKAGDEAAEGALAEGGAEGSAEQAGPAVEGLRAEGPFDSSELPVEEGDATRADLGALSIKGNPEVELRLQVDEASDQVQAVMLIAADGAMELRAFAAPRNEDLWDEIRPQLAEQATRLGGAAKEVEGAYGPALRMQVPGITPDGQRVVQQSTVMGVSGPRWLLRVSMFGRPAVDYQPEALLERTLRSVVVNRGSEPMAPGDTIPLVLPAGVRRMNTPL